MHLITKRSEIKAELPNVFAVDNEFILSLFSRGYDGVKRVTSKFDLFSKDLMMVPVLDDARSHWILVIININKKTITFYDSHRRSQAKISTTFIKQVSKN